MAEKARKTSDVVREVIEKDPVVRKGLARGLVNARAVARHIQDATDTDASLDAIISAIWRYPIKKEAARERSLGSQVTKLSMRDQIFAVGLLNSGEVWRALAELPKEIDVAKGDTLRIISGIEATTVVLDSKNAEKLYALVSRKNIGREFRDLAEITVHLAERSWDSEGVLANLATELTLAGVNIVFHFGYGPPPCIVFEVEEKDAVKAYDALETLKRS
jgi:phosphosulfolactate phosphohydrolase-like enzyme